MTHPTIAEFTFGVHYGHLTDEADKIAQRHNANHINYTDDNGTRRGWFVTSHRGELQNEKVAQRVLRDIDAAGGIEALVIIVMPECSPR
jgi:hypothetical protein